MKRTFHKGQHVLHKTYGRGVVACVSCEQCSQEAMLVRFPKEAIGLHSGRSCPTIRGSKKKKVYYWCIAGRLEPITEPETLDSILGLYYVN